MITKLYVTGNDDTKDLHSTCTMQILDDTIRFCYNVYESYNNIDCDDDEDEEEEEEEYRDDDMEYTKDAIY